MKKLNANVVGANCIRPHFEENTLKNQKAITLIALIITIIVMLILVGVTIDVALDGGLFSKAEEATELTTIATEKENLSLAAIAAWEVGTGVDFDKMGLPEGFSGSAGTYTSSKSGKTYKVDKATAKVTESGAEEVDDDLAYMKAELEGKMFMDVISGLDANSNPIFTNTELKFVTYVRDFERNIIAGIGMYKGKYYEAICDDFSLQNPRIIKVEKATYGVYTDDYFRIGIDGTNAKIFGLTQKGEKDVEANKKLVIPATISFTNGINYNVTAIGESAFYGNTNIEELELSNSVRTIEYRAFHSCTSIKEFTLPSTVQNLARQVFIGWTSEQTIYMEGRTEEPITTDNYSGIGWEHSWQSQCDANIVWDE